MKQMKRLLLIPLLAIWPGPTQAAAGANEALPRVVAPGVEQIGRIGSPAITESSGLAASRRHPGVFWTHNDKGSKPRLFAITREGNLLAQFKIEGVKIADWEDIAIDDEGRLYLGDIGNNEGKRSDVEIYGVDEPDPTSTRGTLQPNRIWRLQYPVKPFDAESLFVHQGAGYVISKVTKDRQAEIYRFALEDSGPRTLESTAKLPITSPVTGADISPDGKRIGVVCKAGAYVFRVDGDVAKAGSVTPWNTRFRHESIEACCFVPEGLMATAESREIFLFNEEAFR
jgi:hypothetical protein